MPSGPDSSSDSSTGSPGIYCHKYSDVPNPDMESCLPGVVSNCYIKRKFSFREMIKNISVSKFKVLHIGEKNQINQKLITFY